MKFRDFPVWACFVEGGSNQDPEDPKVPDPESNNANDGGQQSGESESGSKPFATFPNKEAFDARIARSTKAELEELAKTLGFEDIESMKSAAKKAKDLEESQKSELQKERDAREKLEKESRAVLDRANNRLIDAEIKVLASKLGFVDPTDAIALIDRSDIKVSDTGVVSGVKEAISALLEAKPHLKKEEGESGDLGDSGSDSKKSGSFSMNTLIRKAAGR